jgi:hypothetical protein
MFDRKFKSNGASYPVFDARWTNQIAYNFEMVDDVVETSVERFVDTDVGRQIDGVAVVLCRPLATQMVFLTLSFDQNFFKNKKCKQTPIWYTTDVKLALNAAMNARWGFRLMTWFVLFDEISFPNC